MSDTLFDNNGAPSEHDTSAISEGGAMIFLPFATAHLERIHFANNRARVGGAISLIAGDGSTYIKSCSFVENVAFSTGGAIAFKNAGSNFVVDTRFIENQVVTSVFPPTLVTVRIFTGTTGRVIQTDGTAADLIGR